jgi:TRAP-type C4-dicarboxylate transport system substrate-binding protein
VKRLEDWRGLLVQSISANMARCIQELGGSPVPITWTEGYSALQKGVVEATVQSIDWGAENALSDVCDYLTVCNFSVGMLVVSINKDVWNALPEDVQDLLTEEVARYGEQKREYYMRQAEDYLKRLAGEGMEVIKLDATERERWREKTQAYRDGTLAEMGELGAEIARTAEEANRAFPYTGSSL